MFAGEKSRIERHDLGSVRRLQQFLAGLCGILIVR